MFEFTNGGAWFRWGALDNVSRSLAGASFAFGALAGLLCGLAVNPAAAAEAGLAAHQGPLAVSGLSAALVSAWIWYRFSLRQDELFNRVQNWALGMSGAWTCVAGAVWMILAMVSLAPPASVSSILTMFVLGTAAFWLYGARRWAL